MPAGFRLCRIHPGIRQSSSKLFKRPLFISAQCQKLKRLGNSQAIAHIFFPAAADGLLKPRKGSFDPQTFYIFAGLAIVPVIETPLVHIAR